MPEIIAAILEHHQPQFGHFFLNLSFHAKLTNASSSFYSMQIKAVDEDDDSDTDEEDNF